MNMRWILKRVLTSVHGYLRTNRSRYLFTDVDIRLRIEGTPEKLKSFILSASVLRSSMSFSLTASIPSQWNRGRLRRSRESAVTGSGGSNSHGAGDRRSPISVEESKAKNKFACGFNVDCRARMEPPIPENYFGNCLWVNLVDSNPSKFIEQEGFVIIVKSIRGKIKEILDKSVFHEACDIGHRYAALVKDRVEMLGIVGSNRFRVYENDFGWGKPSKVEISSVDRAITIGLADNRDAKGGVEIRIVLKRPVMELFGILFPRGLSDE